MGGVVKSPGHETWKRCVFLEHPVPRKGKNTVIFQSFALFFQSSAICTRCILAFLEISWLEAEAKHHRLFRCGKSAEIQQKLRKNLRSLYIVHFLRSILLGIRNENPTAETQAILRSFLEAEVEQEVDSEAQIWNSGTLGNIWAMVFLVAKPLVWFVLKKEHTLPCIYHHTTCQRRTCFSFHGDFNIWD